MGYSLENGGELFCCCTDDLIEERRATDYDIVIIDASSQGFDLQFVDENTEYRKIPYLHDFVSKAKELSELYIVCFERYSDIKKGSQVALVVATYQMLTKENFQFVYWEYEQSVQKEYNKLKKYKLRLENQRLIAKKDTAGSRLFSHGSFGFQSNGNTEKEDIRLEMKQIMDKLFFIEKRVESLSNKVDRLEMKIRRISEELSKGWGVLRLYSEVNDCKNLESELFIKKLIDQVIQEQTVNLESISVMKQHEEIEEELCKGMTDEVWNKLCRDSQKLLVTVKIYYEKLTDYDLDGSGICMLSTKVFEIELGRRFVDGYIRHIKEKFRNPAAHKGMITALTVSECVVCLYDTGLTDEEPLLVRMLKDFSV